MNATDNFRAFIGCAKETKEHATHLQVALSEWCSAEIWDQGFVEPTGTIIQSLDSKIAEFDFAIFFVTPHDTTITRKEKRIVPRDNVILEIGISIGKLGISRTFLLFPQGDFPSLPTDITTLQALPYKPNDKNAYTKFAAAGHEIKNVMERQGLRKLNGIDSIIANISSGFHTDVQSIAETFYKTTFGKGVIRRSWSVDLNYDVSKTDSGVITEHMVFNIDCINITNKSRNHEINLLSFDDESLDEFIELKQIDRSGQQVCLLNKASEPKREAGIIHWKAWFEMKPGITYRLKLKYKNFHHVNPNKCYLHNSLTTLEAAQSATLRVTVPSGYEFNLVAPMGTISADRFSDQLDYQLASPLLPNQMIEYMLKKT